VLVLIGVGVAALVLIGLDSGGGPDTKGEFPRVVTKGGVRYAVDDNDDGDKTVNLPSGLRYVEVQEGTGKEAEPGKEVAVMYTGWLAATKKIFDSSKDRGQPFTFKLGAGRVIKGWDEGVAGMKVGGKRKLLIPSKLGYGRGGAPPDIPPDADLVFDVELLKVQ
jgi:FKBP-type peptidyl-prolyl cis-trans isomerase